MKILKTTQIVLMLVFFLQIGVSAQFNGPIIDVNIKPTSKTAMTLGIQNDNFALFVEKDDHSTNIENRKYHRFTVPAITKEEKIDGDNIKLSMITAKGHFSVNINDDYNGEVHFQLLDSKVQLLERKTKFIQDGKNKIIFKNDYQAGTYFLSINYNGETFLKQIIIE